MFSNLYGYQSFRILEACFRIFKNLPLIENEQNCVRFPG